MTDENIELARRVEKGDRRAREEMIERNRGLVGSLAKRYRGRGVPYEDLVQDGMPGLIRAVESYTVAKGDFAVFAVFWIEQAIREALSRTASTIRVPRATRSLVLKIGRVRDEGGDPAKILAEMGVTASRVREVLDALHIVRSPPCDALGSVPDREDRTPETLEKWSMVAAAFAHLTGREQEILARRYGLLGYEAKSAEDVGPEVGLKRSAVGGIERAAIEKLRFRISKGKAK